MWAALTLLIVAGLGNQAHPHAWVLALPSGAGLTAAWLRLKVSRKAERAYTAAVGGCATGWATLTWAFGLVPPLLLALLVGTVLLSIPWWWHYRVRSRIRAPRAMRRRLQRVLDDWPDLSAAVDLSGLRIRSIDADENRWQLHLRLPAGVALADVAAKAGRIEAALKVRPGAVRIEADPARADRCSLVVVVNDPLAEPIAYPAPSGDSVRTPLRVGVFEDGRPVLLDLGQEHVLIGGTTGSGKSGLLNVLIAELAARRDVVLWGIDVAKLGVELGPWRPALDRLATTEDEARALLAAAARVQQARAREMAEAGTRRWRPTPRRPRLVIVVDELSELARDHLCMDLVESLSRLGRQQEIYLVLATQRPTAAALGGLDARANLGVRIALRVDETQDGDLILGRGRKAQGWRPDRLTAAGTFLLRSPQHQIARPARAYLLTDERVAALAVELAPTRPRLDHASRIGARSEQQPLAAPKPRLSPAEQQLRALLAAAPPEGIAVDVLLARIPRSRSWVFARLHALAEEGIARQVRHGYWRSVDQEVGDA
ncbi:MAG: FtsK/SpoIIIE domain-containing protein [Candidatus Dormibacteraceae bacterium]